MNEKNNFIFVIIFVLKLISICQLVESQIVTPDKFNKNDSIPHGKKPDTKVQVTEEKLKEAKALREELLKAVNENRYFTNYNGKSNLYKLAPSLNVTTFNSTTKYRDASENTKQIEKAIGSIFNATNEKKQLAIENKTKHLMSEILGDEVGSNIKNVVSKNTPKEIKVNTIKSLLAPEDEENRKKYLLEDFLPKQLTEREILRVTSIIEDPNFLLGDGVKEWEVLKTEENLYWIGLKDHEILVVNNMDYENATRYDFGYHIVDIETFTFWNLTNFRSTGVILISIHNTIFWFESKELNLIWKWEIGKEARVMKYYEIKNVEYLVIMALDKVNNRFSISVYRFSEENKEFWLLQVIPIKGEAQDMVFLDTGREAILAVSCGNEVLVYDFNPDLEIRYELAAKFKSEDLQKISLFKMGGYSYLAISGREPKILRYYRGDFVLQTRFGEHFQWVYTYFPIPARTYRDDMILLVQHSVEFEGHSLMVLEALVWNGQSFEASGDIPCILGSETYNFGASCMIDLERELGIYGAAIIESGQNISVIVPREDAPSGVFTIQTKLEERKTEKEELQELFEFLNKTAFEQEKIIKEAENMKNYVDIEDELNTDSITATELIFGGDIGEIFLNDHKWTENNENFDIELLLKDLEELNESVKNLEMEYGIEYNPNDSDVSKLKRFTQTYDYKSLELETVTIENLQVESINNQSIPKLIENDVFSFNGTVIFENSMLVKDQIFVQDINSKFRNDENSETVEIDELIIEGNLVFDSINGLPWSEFLSQVTLKQFPIKFDNLIVEGDVIFDQGLEITNLNGIPFPDGFLWSSGPKTSVITAKKNFTGNLETNALDTDGLINGIDPFTFITLSEDQVIPGKITFKQLEVTEELELNGTVSGQDLDDFLSNPTMLETNLIHSECQFKNLKVNGILTVLGYLNTEKFDDILDDFISKNETEEVQVKSRKVFLESLTCSKGAKIKSGKINEIPIENFLTLDTDQELQITNLSGDINVNNLVIDEFYNEINIKNFFKNIVRLDNVDEFTNLTMIFDDSSLLQTSKLHVLKSINTTSSADFVRLNDNIEFEKLKLEEAQADLVWAETDIDGPGKTLNGFDIRAAPDDIIIEQNKSEIFFEHLTIDGDLELNFLNDYKAIQALQILEKVHDIPFMVREGLVTISEMIVNGNVNINGINGRHFVYEILPRVIWLNRPNHIVNPIEFTDKIIFNDDLYINGLLNNENFPALINDIVWKKPITVNNITIQNEIKAPKTFSHPIVVEQNLEAANLNKLSTRNLVSLDKNCNFHGNLWLMGNVEVENLFVGESFNDVEAEVFTNLCKYDTELQSFVIGGKVYFHGNTSIENLNIKGNLNEIENIENFIENLINKNEIMRITSPLILAGDVTFRNNTSIEIFNGQNISSSLQNIAYDDENEIEIYSPVYFNQPVEAETVEIETTLETSNLDGCDLLEWKMNSFYLDDDYHLPVLHLSSNTLNSNQLNVSFLNDHNLANIVTLNTDQNFSSDVFVSEMFLTGNLVTNDPINGLYDLKAEYENTVMTNVPNQVISSPITAKSFSILENLQIDTLVNEEHNITDVAYLPVSTLEINSPIFFRNLSVSEIFTKDIISGFSFNQWYDESLWSSGRTEQTVTGNWYIRNFNVKEKLIGNHNVNNIPLEMVRGQLDGPNEDQQKQLKRLTDNYNVLCQKVQKEIKRDQSRIYFVKYFEKSLTFTESGNVTALNIFNFNNISYLLVNVGCHTTIYQWDMLEANFIQINRFESGSVKEYVPVPNDKFRLSLVINTKNNEQLNCNMHGVNSWTFNAGNNISTIPQQYGSFDSLHTDPKHSGVIFGIPVNQNSIVEMKFNQDSTNENINQTWELPIESRGLYRFLPGGTEFGTAVSDGSKILMINQDTIGNIRKKRDISEHSNEMHSRKDNKKLKEIGKHLQVIIQNLIKVILIGLEQLEATNSFQNVTTQTFTVKMNQILQNIQKLEILQNSDIKLLKKFDKNETINSTVAYVGLNVTETAWNSLEQLHMIIEKHVNDSAVYESLVIHHEHGFIETLKVFKKKLVKGIATAIIAITNSSKNIYEHSTNNTELLKHSLTNLAIFLSNRLEYLKSSSYPSNQHKEFHLEYPIGKSNISEKGILFNPTNENGEKIYNSSITNPLFTRKHLEEYFQEPVVGQVVTNPSKRNLLVADNVHIPNKISGEVLAIQVSFTENRRTLFAVINTKQQNYGTGALRNDKENSIKIFFDIMQGHIFQKISANTPRNLVALNIRDETIVGFIDGDNLIRIYIYRGIQGFIEFAEIKSEYPIDRLLGVSLPKKDTTKEIICPEFYFIASGGHKFTFYQAILAGSCSVHDDLKCDNII